MEKVLPLMVNKIKSMRTEPNKKELKALNIASDKQLLQDEIDRVLSMKTWSDQKKIDTLLLFDHTLHGNLDVTNQKSEKKEVIRRSRMIYKGIKNIDKTIGESFLQLQDEV
jgi:hypothetical protein